MPLIVAKLFSEDSKDELDAAVAAYKAGAGSELLDTQRAMAADDFEEPDGDMRMSVLLAHGGIDTPGTGTKTADLQHVNAVAQGDLAACQDAIDEALANAVHESVGDGDTTVAGTITTTTPLFTTGGPSEDIGRKVRIGEEVRTITAVASTTSASYDDAAEGAFTSGTGLTVELLGAESIQDARLEMQKRHGKFRMHALLAVEGELY